MALKFFILIVVLLITLVSCEILPNIDKSFLRNRILNGHNAEIGEAPYIVSLKCTPHGDHFCGGSIISKSIILTAAHCLKCPLYVVAGMHKRDNETGTQIVKVIKQIRHEKFEDSDKPHPYDIALLFVEKCLQYNSRVQPIELPEVDSDVTGEGKFFGWGLKGFEHPNILQTTTTNILRHDKCQAVLNTLGSNDPNILCTSSYLTTACKGDSGGPLVKSINGNTTLVGILSYGRDSCQEFAVPAFFTNTQSYLEWIKNNVANFI